MFKSTSVHLTDGEKLDFPKEREFWIVRRIKKIFRQGFCKHGTRYVPVDRILEVYVETDEEREHREETQGKENPLRNFPPKS